MPTEAATAFDDLQVEFSPVDVDSWKAWAAMGDARDGRLAFMDPTFNTELGALVLEDLRPHGMTPLAFSTNNRAPRHRAYVDVGQAYFAQVTFIPRALSIVRRSGRARLQSFVPSPA